MFESYLSHREQVLKIQNTDWGTTRIHLGPSVVYIILKRPFSSPKTLQTTRYVDDTTLFLWFPSSKLHDVIFAVNEDLKNISTWCCRNSLLINPDKMKLLYVGVPQLMRTLPATLPTATILGTEIKLVPVAKDLGVHIDCHLNFNEHITKTARDCIFKLTRVNRLSTSWIKKL